MSTTMRLGVVDSFSSSSAAILAAEAAVKPFVQTSWSAGERW